MSDFTPRAQQVLALARKEADRFNHNFVGTEHLLLGIIALGQGTAANVLVRMGLDLESVRNEVEKMVGTGPDQKMVGKIPYTPRVKKVLTLAAKEAAALNHTYVGTEHILLGLLREGDGVAARTLKHFNLELEATRNSILAELDPSHQTATTSRQSASASPTAAPITTARATTASSLSLGESVDTVKRYDIHCTDWAQGVTVYHNARFKSVKSLFQRSQYDALSAYFEIELEDGRTLFVSRSSVIRFEERPTGSGK